MKRREYRLQPTSDEGTPVTDLVRALFSRSQTFSTERHEALEQVEKLERTLHAKERELAELRKAWVSAYTSLGADEATANVIVNNEIAAYRAAVRLLRAPQDGKAEHPNTEACGFDRSASLTEDTYVCTCGYRTPRGDGHPEDTCERCGRENVTWFAPSPLWNQYARTPDGDPMLCPVCFIKAAEAAGCKGAAWKVEPETPPPATPRGDGGEK